MLATSIAYALTTPDMTCAVHACCWQIQGVMVDYFGHRQGPMARDGIGALQKSLAAIYYLPFQCGVNLFFRFSGQSIPNR
jgi:hypothetical protein